ncbi:hypothetical protein ACSQ67_002628 [Phaseolus vulgaris]
MEVSGTCSSPQAKLQGIINRSVECVTDALFLLHGQIIFPSYFKRAKKRSLSSVNGSSSRVDACLVTAVSQIPTQPLPWNKRYRLPITLADNSKT